MGNINSTSKRAETDSLQKTIKKATKKAKKISGKIVDAVAETPELISLRRNEHAIRSEIDDQMLAIGKRVLSLHKRARKSSPFERYSTLMTHLDTLARLEKEYSSNRVQLNQLRERIRGKGK
jgi:hypothetical protein